MVVRDIIQILEGEIICEGDLDQEIKPACGLLYSNGLSGGTKV